MRRQPARTSMQRTRLQMSPSPAALAHSQPQSPLQGGKVLPLEIWWLICKDLAGGLPDFDALFNTALVNRDLARLALPVLYSVHSQASASTSDASVAGQRKWALLWRSLVLSSIDKTAFPYALWIRKLELGNLVNMLEAIRRFPDIATSFFRGDMSRFRILAKNDRGLSRQRQLLDFQAISLEVGERLTSFVRDAAERDDKVVTLASLEGDHIPVDVLPLWISRLSTLRSLTLRDGSVLTDKVAAAIRGSCPSFVELCCFNCLGDTVDEDMAGFFLGLPPHSLECFQVISDNQLGQQAFAALGHHARSLKTLQLSGLDSVAVPRLNALGGCTALEALWLEGTRQNQISWEGQHNDSFQEVASWLRRCEALRSVVVKLLPDASLLLSKVLLHEALQLRHLEVKLSESKACDALFAAIGHQSRLRSLHLAINDEAYDHDNDRQLASAVLSSCRDLVVLQLAETRFESPDMWELGAQLNALEKLSFGGIQEDSTRQEDVWEDDVWSALLLLPCLNAVLINGLSSFSPEGVRRFVAGLVGDDQDDAAAAHWGFSLEINSQIGLRKFSEEDEESISRLCRETLGGEFAIGYENDPDEDHESDFSD